jgi:hypothetical protein
LLCGQKGLWLGAAQVAIRWQYGLQLTDSVDDDNNNKKLNEWRSQKVGLQTVVGSGHFGHLVMSQAGQLNTLEKNLHNLYTKLSC